MRFAGFDDTRLEDVYAVYLEQVVGCPKRYDELSSARDIPLSGYQETYEADRHRRN